MIKVVEVSQEDPLFRDYKKIRYDVFVIEQGVPEEDEFDKYEVESRHYLALSGETPVGTARWRQYGDLFKLERFAVLDSFRGKGVGRKLVEHLESVLHDFEDIAPGQLFMHAQSEAIDFYQKLGYSVSGEEFEECGIKHRTMTK